MDEAIVSGLGGFGTRAELMREAVENLLNELSYEEAPPEPPTTALNDRLEVGPSSGGRLSQLDELVASVASWERTELTVGDLVGTKLELPDRTPQLMGSGVVEVPQQPLLGLHNRDYVSVWAAARLARYTTLDLIPFDEYLRRVTAAAWFVGAQLDQLDARDKSRKLAVLFPTNTTKQPSAERGFQTFAIGSLSRPRDGSRPVANGPLFAWGVIQLQSDADGLVGLTPAGWTLLTELKDLSLDLPHSQEHTRRFLDFLAEHAPADKWGFDHVLHVVAEAPDRDSLVASFAESHPEWSGATASSVAQGYIARSREWGLVEQKLVEGRYWLTDLGRAWAATGASAAVSSRTQIGADDEHQR